MIDGEDEPLAATPGNLNQCDGVKVAFHDGKHSFVYSVLSNADSLDVCSRQFYTSGPSIFSKKNSIKLRKGSRNATLVTDSTLLRTR